MGDRVFVLRGFGLLKGPVKGILRLLCLVLVIPFLVVALLYHAASATLLDAAFYHQLFDRHGVYDRLAGDLVRVVVSSPDIPAPFKGVSAEIAREVVTPSVTREQGPVLIGATLDYITGKTETFVLPVSLSSLRGPLEDSLARRLPGALAGVARDAIDQLPEEFDISSYIGMEGRLGVERVRDTVKTARFVALVVAPLAVLVLGLLVWALCGRRFSSVVMWLGGSLFIAGLVVVAAAYAPFSLPVGGSGLTGVTSMLTGLDLPQGIPGFDRQTLLSVVRDMLSGVVGAVTDRGTLATGAGVVLVAFAWLIRRLSVWGGQGLSR